MATTTRETGPAAVAGPPPSTTRSHDPDSIGEKMLELVTGIQQDADRARHAMASLSELLSGCSEEHLITASCLLQLIEPVRGYVEMVSDDLGTLLHADGWLLVREAP